MGIQKDSGEILTFLYDNKIKGKEIPQLKDLIEVTKWEKDKVIFALEYLIGKSLVDGKEIKSVISTKTQFIAINGLTPFGIDVIENVDKFKKNFNFTINLGLIQYSWGASEK